MATNRRRSFFSDGPAGPIYASHRDHKSKADLRERIEVLWERYQPYCPDRHEHFLKDSRERFVQRTWEMYLACALLDAGFKLEKPPPKGPDLLVAFEGGRLWIEAVAPSAGAGPDAVPGRDQRGHIANGIWMGRPPPEEALILRCASAITGKLQKWQDYVSDGVVNPIDRFAVALSLGDVDEAFMASPDMPIVLKALFPIGDHYFSVPIGQPGAKATTGYRYRDTVVKKTGAPVATTVLQSHPAANSLVGVFFSEWGIWNAPARTGSDIVFIHNPFMPARVREGMFSFVRDEWIPGPNGTIMPRSAVRAQNESVL